MNMFVTAVESVVHHSDDSYTYWAMAVVLSYQKKLEIPILSWCTKSSSTKLCDEQHMVLTRIAIYASAVVTEYGNHSRITCKTSLTLCEITPFFVASFSMSCSACKPIVTIREEQLKSHLSYNTAPLTETRPSSREIFQESCRAFLPRTDHAFYSASLHA